jgi:HEPN domain-containing protein
VTNHERGRRLLAAAGELYQELEIVMERKAWNLAVRRAQEVVELALKGFLSLMGIDYPIGRPRSEHSEGEAGV